MALTISVDRIMDTLDSFYFMLPFCAISFNEVREIHVGDMISVHGPKKFKVAKILDIVLSDDAVCYLKLKPILED